MFKKFKSLSMSKKLIVYLFFNCTLIEVFTLIITLISVLQLKDTLGSPDFSALNALIGCFCAEVVGYGIYCLKSTKENTEGGIIYEKMKMAQEEEANG